MSRFVLDASVGLKMLVVEQDTDKARLLRDDFANAIHELLAPDVFPVEVTHALTRAERQGRVTPAEGAVLFKDLLPSLPNLRSSVPLLPRAYEISSTMRVGVYDCLYVALGELEQCELITADDKLLKNLGTAFPFIRPLSSMP